MASVHDVAKYLLNTHGSMSAMRLQKLLYYSQAWSLVWEERPLFDEPIEAWANGPVVPAIYAEHKGKFSISQWPHGNLRNVDPLARETIDIVFEHYKKYNTQQLSDLTHAETPWREARRGIPDGERGSQIISQASMAEYYSSL